MIDGAKKTLTTYRNPCLNRWITNPSYNVPSSSTRFGPNDTAICAILETADHDGAYSDARVFIDFDTPSAISTNAVKECENYGLGPCMKFENEDEDDNDPSLLEVWWANYNDYTNGNSTSYGSYLFNEPDSFVDIFRIIKEYDFKEETGYSFGLITGGDGDDSWHMLSHDIYVFNPGKSEFLNRHILRRSNHNPSGDADAAIIFDDDLENLSQIFELHPETCTHLNQYDAEVGGRVKWTRSQGETFY